MRIKKIIPIEERGSIPFRTVYWGSFCSSVFDLMSEGWEVTLSTQTNWRHQSPNDYYYFRKDGMVMRITRQRNALEAAVWADFMLPEKKINTSRWKEEETTLRRDEREFLSTLTVSELLDEIIKRQPEIKRKPKPKPSADILNFEDFLQKVLVEKVA